MMTNEPQIETPTRHLMLVIMDGWGIAEDPTVSAIDQGRTHFYQNALLSYPNSKLKASEQAVGLPPGQMGNSEVGHLNIGAGRIIYQQLDKIQRAIDSGEFIENPTIQRLVAYCKQNQAPLHLMGLVSTGGVHSSLDHLTAMLESFSKMNIPQIYIHAFLDGRDTAPQSGLKFMQTLQQTINRHNYPAKIVSLIGRYYAMDRDKRWERVKKAYDLLIHGIGETFPDPQSAIEYYYQQGITDEFMAPCVISNHTAITVQPEEAALFFNFRTDRGRELTQVLTQQDFPEYGMQTLPLHYVTLTEYDKTFKNVGIVFKTDSVQDTLGEVLSTFKKKQLRIAETEKYPHVTYFFNGGKESNFDLEDRILCQSPKVATYDLKPQMSAFDIEREVLKKIVEKQYDFICLNFANPDMVGHTGVFQAAIKACESVDYSVSKIVKKCTENDYAVLIISDHGNADKMENPDGSPHTAHTLARVPCILIDPRKEFIKIRDGVLADVAPTILKIMGIPIPAAMTGQPLV